MKNRIISLALAAVICLVLTACGGGDGGSGGGGSSSSNADPNARRETRTTLLVPEASGEDVRSGSDVEIDASHVDKGYVMIRYNGSADKAKVQIGAPDGATYSYTLLGNDFETFPISAGDGDYHIDVLEHAFEKMYALLFSTDLSVKLGDQFLPFLYPNQYVWFEKGDEAVKLAESTSNESSDDLNYVAQVYHYVTRNISYDTDLAQNVSVDYLPDIDVTLSSGKGICFDYASLMAAMLRSQGIPTKLVVGYSGQAYHAWISVYLEETGWVEKVIEFDGKDWSLMDPTLAANNDAGAVKKYVGDGSNYTVKYNY